MQGSSFESCWRICLTSSVLQGLVADIKVLVANPVRPEFLAAGADGVLQTWDLTSHELKGGCFRALAHCGCSKATSACPEGTSIALQTCPATISRHSCSLSGGSLRALPPQGCPGCPGRKQPALCTPELKQSTDAKRPSHLLLLLQTLGASKAPLASDASSSLLPAEHSPNHHFCWHSPQAPLSLHTMAPATPAAER